MTVQDKLYANNNKGFAANAELIRRQKFLKFICISFLNPKIADTVI